MTVRGLSRFWDKVEKTEGCWLWTASRTPRGYGKFHFGGKLQPAHRLSFAAANGPIPDGKFIDHICHNTRCVKPSHLRAVTPKQNSEHKDGAHVNSTTGVRGVFVDNRWTRPRYWGQVVHAGRRVYVGTFNTLPDAEAAVTAKRNELFTHNDQDRAKELTR